MNLRINKYRWPRNLACLVAAALATSCVSSSVTPMGRNTFAVTTIVDAECGLTEANKIAFEQIAASTIKNGYDAFEIVQIQSGQSSELVGMTPIVATGNASGGYNIFGGQPIVSSQFNQNVVVRMYHSTDPEASMVIDARKALGPDWTKTVVKTKATCF